MTRHLFLAITLIAAGMFLQSPAKASALQCEDRAANCVGRCANRTGGAGDWGGHQNKCMVQCDRRLTACVIRDIMTRPPSGWRPDAPWDR